MDDQLQDDEQHLVVSDALRRYWLPITVATVVFGLIGGIYAYSRPTHYTASAKVLVRAIAGNPLSPDSTSTSQQVSLSMTTEAGVVNSPAVVKIIGNKLDKTLQPGTSVIQATVVPNTEILEIKYTASSASEAESGAQASADSFLEYRESRATGTVAQTITRLNAQIKTVQAQVKHAAFTAGQANAPINAASQLQIYASRLESLQASVQELQVADPNPGTVVSPARRPSAPSGLSPLIYLIGAALFGLGLSMVGAVWRARNDERVRGNIDAAVHGLPVLAALPPTSRSTLIDVTAADEFNEAFRRLRTGVLVGVNRPAVIVVTSMSGKVRSGPLATNLGLSLADAGFRVCVVDAEVDAPLAGNRLGTGSKLTLANVLADDDFQASAVRRERGIGVIPAGPDSAGLRDQLASSRFRAVIQGLRRNNDYVVVAAPPASTADGSTVALASDRLILAVVDRQTTRDEVYSVGDRFERLNVHIMGLMVISRPSWWQRLRKRDVKPTAKAVSSPLSARAPSRRTPRMPRTRAAGASMAASVPESADTRKERPRSGFLGRRTKAEQTVSVEKPAAESSLHPLVEHKSPPDQPPPPEGAPGSKAQVNTTAPGRTEHGDHVHGSHHHVAQPGDDPHSADDHRDGERRIEQPVERTAAGDDDDGDRMDQESEVAEAGDVEKSTHHADIDQAVIDDETGTDHPDERAISSAAPTRDD